MKKKISRKEYTEICGRHAIHKWWQSLLFSYTLTKEQGTFIIKEHVNLLAYILLFIPVHLLQALCCLWDGLKEFEVEKRHIKSIPIYECDKKYSPRYDKAERIWNSKSYRKLIHK